MEMFYRIQESSRDPQTLLSRENWVSRIWTGYAERPCPDCKTSGVTLCDCDGTVECFRCEFGSLPCRTCRGQGWVEDTERWGGVSCCWTVEELLDYFSGRHATLDDCVLIALEGEASDVEDYDAEAGAVLVQPSRIVSVRPLDPAEVARCSADV